MYSAELLPELDLPQLKSLLHREQKVIITGRNQETIDETNKKLSKEAIGIRADSVYLTDIKNLTEEVKTLYGKVDVLFVNAAISFQEIVG